MPIWAPSQRVEAAEGNSSGAQYGAAHVGADSDDPSKCRLNNVKFDCPSEPAVEGPSGSTLNLESVRDPYEEREVPQVSIRARPSTDAAAPVVRAKSQHRAIFLDPEDMKEKVRQNLIKPTYSVCDFYHKSGLWQKIARHPVFEHLTLGVIFINAVWIAVDTDRNHAPSLLTAEPIFQIAEQCFCVYFSFEWFVRFKAFKFKRDGLKDRWFVFDSLLVLMMVAETWVMQVVLLLTSAEGGSSGGLGNVTILRLFRLLRLSRMARMLRSFPELMILIKGITAATRSVLLVIALLVLFMYIFAIAFTQLAAGTDIGNRYFNKVGPSMYSLLIYGTFLDNLSVMCQGLLEEAPACLVLFWIFVLLSALMLINMLIGVLCQVVSAVAAAENEVRTVDFVTTKLQGILDKLDENGDRRISKAEFMTIMEHEEAVHALDEVGVDPVGIIDFADFIFDGTSEAEVGLDFPDFMDLVLKFRGSNTATVKDIVDLRKFVFSTIDQVTYSLMRPTREKNTKKSLRRPAPAPCSGNGLPDLGLPMSQLSTTASTDSIPPLPEGLSDDSTTQQARHRSTEESMQDHEAMRRLQQRVARVEDGLVALLGEVRKLNERLPQAATLPLPQQSEAHDASSAQLPHLLRLQEDSCLSATADKKSALLPPDDDKQHRWQMSGEPQNSEEPRSDSGTLC